MEKTTSSQPGPAQGTGLARLLAACYQRPADTTPVWFMRQAGHCLTAYRELRARHDILTIASTPELCSQVSLMPVEEYGVDAAVMYTDIILPLAGMGLKTDLDPTIGPIIHNPVRTMRDVESLHTANPWETTPFVMDAIRMVKQELQEKKGVIGIAGGVFTLALYIIEGRPARDYPIARSMMYQQPEVWHALMEKLTATIRDYAVAEVEAGASIIQIFDSSVGILGPSSYRTYVQPYMRRIFQAIKQAGAPAIHFGTGNTGLLNLMSEAGGDVMGIDWRIDLDDVWRRIDYQHAIQGNMDPTLLLAPWESVEAGMQDIMTRVGGRPGHIFNLGHAVHPGTNPDYLRRLVDAVHEYQHTTEPAS